MFYLNFNDLNGEAQERLLNASKKDVEQKFGISIHKYATEHILNYDEFLEQEAMRNLYSYSYHFKV